MKIRKDPTLQAVYNYVSRHLLAQGTEAEEVAGGEYVLQDSHGRSCAIGCLIKPGTMVGVSDEETSPRVRRAICDSLGVERLYPHTIRLLTSLRYVHDVEQVCEWRGALRHVAIAHGLEPLPEVTP